LKDARGAVGGEVRQADVRAGLIFDFGCCAAQRDAGVVGHDVCAGEL